MRKLRFRKGSWILIPVLFLGFFSSPVKAENQPGLLLTVYNNFGYNNAPPLPAISGRPSVGTVTVSQINHNFDQVPFFQMYEDFIVHYEGYITSPISGDFILLPQADDGTKVYIDDVLVQNDWRDKGGGGSPSSVIHFDEGVSKKIELWFYENGGGAWVTLYWNINQYWEIVPESAFTMQSVETTTTTELPTTTTELPTTTTEAPTTTTTELPTTTTVYTAPETTTTTTTATTTTTTSSTTIPIVVTTLATTTTSITTTIPETTTTLKDNVDKEVSQLLSNTEDLSKEEIIAAVENIIKDGISKEEAVAIATEPEIINSITGDEAKEIFKEIAVSELSPEEELALVTALTDAPAEVKEAFEEEIDIFGEGLDEYVPTGSNVDVKTRRAVIAVTALTTTLTVAPMPSGGTSSAPSGGPSGGSGPSGDDGSSEDRKVRRSRRK